VGQKVLSRPLLSAEGKTKEREFMHAATISQFPLSGAENSAKYYLALQSISQSLAGEGNTALNTAAAIHFQVSCTTKERE
jgi:hypothetical protein